MACLSPCVLELARKELTFDWLPKDLVSHVLSYVALSDVNAVRQVCRIWHEVTQKPAFWKRLIESAKVIKTKWSCPLGNACVSCKAAIDAFDTFISPLPEPLVKQVGWMFRKQSSNLVVFHSDDNLNRHVVRTNLEHIFYQIDNSLIATVWVECRNPLKGRYVRDFHRGQPCKRLEMDDFKNDSGIITTTLFKGQCILIPNPDSTRRALPHGNGKWTFEDGTVLEGEGVAWKGNPRYLTAPPPPPPPPVKSTKKRRKTRN